MTRTIETAFTQEFLRLTMLEVRKHTTAEERRKAWTYRLDRRGHHEFHGPNGFYWHGCAGDKYDARAKGWSAYLTSIGKEGIR